MVIFAVACKHKRQSTVAATNNDTAFAAADTAVIRNPYTEADRIRDSLERLHLIDSLYSIKPLAIYRPGGDKEALDALLTNFIDAGGVVRIPIVFTDTIIYKYNKQEESVSQRQISRSKRFVIEIAYSYEDDEVREFLINGYKLRAGIEVDTSLSGSFYAETISLNSSESCLMKFGNREYLFLSGGIDGCNGMGCGVCFYLLYDLNSRKAMLLQQYRSEFFVGYDKKSNSPVFFDMGENGSPNHLFGCFFFSGKAYRLDKTNRIKPFTGKDRKQVEFDAYSKDGVDSLILTSATFPVK